MWYCERRDTNMHGSRILFPVLIYMFAAGVADAAAAQASAQKPPDAPGVPIYTDADGVTAPVLLPAQYALATHKCEQHERGSVMLFLIVDADGSPRNIFFEHAIGSDLDRVALNIAERDRFTPGKLNGVPVAVAESLQVVLSGCIWEAIDGGGNTKYELGLATEPSQQFAAAVDAPKNAVLTSGAGNPGDAGMVKADAPAKRLNEIKLPLGPGVPGFYEIKFWVDRNGMPQKLQTTKSPHGIQSPTVLGAVRRLRFRPAMRNGTPVVSQSIVEIEF